MAIDTPNVVCESGWRFQARIAEFARQPPKHKIVFGTNRPPNEPGMWLREPVDADQDVTAVVWALAARGQHPALFSEQVRGVGRMLGSVGPAGIHAEYHARSRRMLAPCELDRGAVVEVARSDGVDLAELPMITHFATDCGPCACA